MASLVAQLVKNSPAKWETWVPSLGREDPLEKGKATHSVFWPGEFHGLYSPWGHKELDKTERLSEKIVCMISGFFCCCCSSVFMIWHIWSILVMFHEHLKRICILFMFGVFCKCQLDPVV